MLPYRLRKPLFGSWDENRKRKADGSLEKVESGGGPVQQAIEHDLADLQENFLKTLEEAIQAQEKRISIADEKEEERKWKEGEAFSIFKEVFGERKMALLHQVVPHPKVDREAFSQIIYAAGLEQFRKSMQTLCANDFRSIDEKTKRSIASIFTIYALHETNPLLRIEDMSSLQYLPLGVRAIDISQRRSSRRSFRQPIRIDRQHYAMVLQLFELCRAHVAKCGREESSNSCECSLARDAIRVIKRLSLHLDFCDYTGPIGLEGLAGHSDYKPLLKPPKTKKQKRSDEKSTGVAEEKNRRKQSGATIEIDESDFEVYQFSSTLQALMLRYQASIQSLRLGPVKTATVAQLRGILGTVLPNETKMTWTKIQDKLFRGENSSGETREPSLKNSGRPLDAGGSEVGRHTTCHADTGENTMELDARIHLSFEKDTDEQLQPFVLECFQKMLKRYGDEEFAGHDQAFIGISRATRDGDMSTLGDGGISLATGHAKSALQKLLLEASTTKQVPVHISTIGPTGDLALGEHEGAMGFLTFDVSQDIDESWEDDDVSDFSKDSDDELDDASAATSAVGKHALETLLRKVSKAQENKAAPSKRRVSTKKRTEASDQSFVSSVGQGELALGELLREARTREKLISTDTKKKAAPNKKISHTDQSVSSSVGPGTLALHRLLQESEESVKNKNAASTSDK